MQLADFEMFTNSNGDTFLDPATPLAERWLDEAGIDRGLVWDDTEGAWLANPGVITAAQRCGLTVEMV